MAVISACIKLIKVVEFLCSHFNIVDEKLHNIFGIFYFIISRKEKQLKCKKCFVQCMKVM